MAEETCPPATQDIELNLKNRQNAIDNVGYGPLNPAEPNDVFWQDKAEKWNTTVREAKSAVCGNCIFFIRTPEMLECIENGIGLGTEEAEGSIAAGELGYCNALDFKCASERTCNAWAAGGPVTAGADIDLLDEIEPLTAAKGPCWEGYVQVGMKKKNGKMVPNCVPASEASEFGKKKRTISQTPAPKKDRIKGSDKNTKGSASGGKKITFTPAIESALQKKAQEHNEKAPKGRKTSVSTLKAVYRRGAGAYSVSHRPGMTRNQWAMARVNAFLRLLKSGKPKNSAYKADNDLLPAGHPRSTKKNASSLIASGLIPEEQDLADALIAITRKHGPFDQDGDGVWAGYTPASENDVKDIGVKCSNCVFFQGPNKCQIISLEVEADGKCRFAVIPEGVVDISQVPVRDEEDLELLLASAEADAELTVELKSEEDYETPEQAIFAMTEFAGLGYEAEPAFRAAWLRAVRNNEDPFKRASVLAVMTYDSMDSDLLPKRKN